MAQEQHDKFYARAARLERSRALGHGFEAVGTLGRSHYHRAQRRHFSFIGPVLVVATCFFAVKVAMHYDVGHDSYQDRVERMIAADAPGQKMGGFLMQADPVTVWLSDRIRQYLG